LTAPKMPVLRKLGPVLSRCTTRLGTIVDRDQITEAVLDLPIGDRVFLLFAVRRASLGDDYPFNAVCPECEKSALYVQNLSELETIPMGDPKTRVFDCTLPSGKTARYHVMTGRHEDKIANLDKGTDGVSLSILARLDLLNGKPPTLAEVKALGMRDRNCLRDQFAEVEGGFNTIVDMECSHCGHKFETELEVNQSFFTPSATRKNSKRKSSS